MHFNKCKSPVRSRPETTHFLHAFHVSVISLFLHFDICICLYVYLLTIIDIKIKIKTFLQVKDVLAIHRSTCPNYNPNVKIQLSCDGVSESKSTVISLDVYSIKFDGCKNIYALKIIRPIKKTNFDHKLHLTRVLHDIHDNNLTIGVFIGDNPKRSNAKCVLCHSSWFPCEYCCCKGTKIVLNNAEIAKKKKLLTSR